jgi:AbiTii
MSALLDDIINLAVDGKQPLPDILRKCLLLGHELRNQRLIDWANQELNGYQSGKDVPEYRIMPALARGNFIGPFHAQYNRFAIPSVALEERHREFGERVYLLQSVSAYTDVLSGRGSSSSSSVLTFDWDPNMVAYYQRKLMANGFVCISAWQEIPVNALAEVLDTIRNRTLNMALQIKDELGTSYADLRRIAPGEASKIQSIVFNNVGGSTNVAMGGSTVNATTVIAVGDRRALDDALSALGMDKQDLDGLTEAMKRDGEKPDKSVTEWVKEKASKVLAGGVKVGTTVGTQILTALIMQHYGIH